MLMPTLISTHKKTLLVGLVALVLIGTGLMWSYMNAPMFVQFGETHFLAGGQWYTRTQGEGYADYMATKESLWVALANDPNPMHWWPVKVDLVE